MIFNHASARLSDLDLVIAQSVPPGGNWKNIPDWVPSARIAQIRTSFAAGLGSRSTYYGRLVWDRPSYTIGTYYNRPGNGCFLHPDFEGGQHRTLSHREAARLQSFPDTFVFTGPQRAICQQIGNAVPPLLAYQIATALGDPGDMVDVFAGAGGLSLGFEWAGWRSLAATDNDAHAVSTFNQNVGPVAFVGDMTDRDTHTRLLSASRRTVGKRLALIGGPPCQGFSTGGKKRTLSDARNHLHEAYSDLLHRLKPGVFVFENVTGLLSIDGGRFVGHIRDGFRQRGYETVLWRLNAAHYGVPQRRERVIIVGVPIGSSLPDQPKPWSLEKGGDGAKATTVADAISDLPAVLPGVDGSGLPYRGEPETDYQRLMRGRISPSAFVSRGVPDDTDWGQAAISTLARHA